MKNMLCPSYKVRHSYLPWKSLFIILGSLTEIEQKNAASVETIVSVTSLEILS